MMELVLQDVYSPVDVRVGGGVVQVHTDGALHVSLVEIWCQVGWGSRVIRGMADIVGTAAAEAMRESVVTLRLESRGRHLRVVNALDVVTAHGLRFAADREDRRVGVRRDRSAVVVLSICSGVTASLDLVLAAVRHGVCKLGILVNCVVVRLDAVRVVDGELCGCKVSLIPFNLTVSLDVPG